MATGVGSPSFALAPWVSRMLSGMGPWIGSMGLGVAAENQFGFIMVLLLFGVLVGGE